MIICLLLVLPRCVDIGDQLLIELIDPLGVVLHFSDDLLEQDIAITLSEHRVNHLFEIAIFNLLLTRPGHLAHPCAESAAKIAELCFLFLLCRSAVSALHRSFMH